MDDKKKKRDKRDDRPQCPFCGKRVANADKLAAHMMSKHNPVRNRNDD